MQLNALSNAEWRLVLGPKADKSSRICSHRSLGRGVIMLLHLTNKKKTLGANDDDYEIFITASDSSQIHHPITPMLINGEKKRCNLSSVGLSRSFRARIGNKTLVAYFVFATKNKCSQSCSHCHRPLPPFPFSFFELCASD